MTKQQIANDFADHNSIKERTLESLKSSDVYKQTIIGKKVMAVRFVNPMGVTMLTQDHQTKSMTLFYFIRTTFTDVDSWNVSADVNDGTVLQILKAILDRMK